MRCCSSLLSSSLYLSFRSAIQCYSRCACRRYYLRQRRRRRRCRSLCYQMDDALETAIRPTWYPFRRASTVTRPERRSVVEFGVGAWAFHARTVIISFTPLGTVRTSRAAQSCSRDTLTFLLTPPLPSECDIIAPLCVAVLDWDIDTSPISLSAVLLPALPALGQPLVVVS